MPHIVRLMSLCITAVLVFTTGATAQGAVKNQLPDLRGYALASRGWIV